MRTTTIFLMLAMSALAGAAHADLYKWTGPDGKVIYSDRPPPAYVAAEKKSVASTQSGTPLPYELAQAASNHPVVLYTSSVCAPCDAARNLLNQRGIPFSEKTVTTAEDAVRLKKVAGTDGQLPVMTAGRTVEVGFEPGAWSTALTAAGYPQASRLPRGYRNPAPEPAAPPPVGVAAQSDTAASEKTVDRAARAPAARDASDSAAPARGGFQF